MKEEIKTRHRTSGVDMHTISRRILLKLSAAAGIIAALPKGAWGIIVDYFPTRTVERGEFRFSPRTGEVEYQDGSKETYILSVQGLVDSPLNLTYSDLIALPQVGQTSDFHCVEGWTVPDVNWGGVRLMEIFSRAGLREDAQYAVFHSLGATGGKPGGLDHYVECLPVADLLNPNLYYLLALTKDGEPLSHDRGAPLRLVTPFDLAYKSIKFVTRIELTNRPVDGWWTRANAIYPRHAPVPADRLREPDPRAS